MEREEKGEEAARAIATRFFFHSRMRGRVYFDLSCCLAFVLFCFVLLVGSRRGSRGSGMSHQPVPFRPGDED
jgi:hypothetical protein